MRININILSFQRVGRNGERGVDLGGKVPQLPALSPPTAVVESLAPRVEAPGQSALSVSEKLQLIRAAAAEVARSQGALDIKGGVVVTLATALAFATAVRGGGAQVETQPEPVWAFIYAVFAGLAIATGVVSLLIRSIGVDEPGMRIIQCHVDRPGAKDLLQLELLWLRKADRALSVRKYWMLAAYAFLLAAGMSVFFATAFGFLI